MLPEVETFTAAYNEAHTTYNDAYEALRKEYNGLYGIDREPFYNKCSELERARNEKIVAAWNALGESTDPVVKFIAENCQNYASEAIEVLKALPATLDQLEKVADELDWCGVWGRFVDRAIEAGVFGDEGRISAEYRVLKNYLTDDFGLSRRQYVKVESMVGDIVKAAVTAALKATLTEIEVTES